MSSLVTLALTLGSEILATGRQADMPRSTQLLMLTKSI